MLEDSLIENYSYSHWLTNLSQYPDHPLKKVITDFSGNLPDFLLSSYLYIGELIDSKNIKKTICILHYHSELNGHMKFMDMQNLNSYKSLFDLNSSTFSHTEIYNLGLEITRDTVIDMSDLDSLTIWHLDRIYIARYFFITDETGFIKEYNWEC